MSLEHSLGIKGENIMTLLKKVELIYYYYKRKIQGAGTITQRVGCFALHMADTGLIPGIP